MLKHKKQSGFTFTELLIALAINAIIFIALIGMFIENLNHYRKTLAINKLQYQLQSALDVMSNDIRRTGYWLNAQNDVGTGQNNNPFMAAGADISTPTSSCILLTYDRDNNGALPAISSTSDDERFGYRLINNTIQTRPWGAAFDCNASATDWENIIDTNIIQITQLNFNLITQTVTTGPGSRGIAIRTVDITLTGQLKNDPSITKTLTQHIRVRNDKYIP